MRAVATWEPQAEPSHEISFAPARILLQDFTGVPAVVDLAAMRDAMAELGGDPARINPSIPAELVIDHSVQVDAFAIAHAPSRATSSSSSSATSSATPSCAGASARSPTSRSSRPAPASATRSTSSSSRAWSRTATASRSRTRSSAPTRTRRWSTASACSAGAWAGSRPRRRCSASRSRCSCRRSSASGCYGRLREGATATDLVLTVTELLRKTGVVGKFVEYFGEGLAGPVGRRPRDAREHVARVRRDVRLLPRRRADARVPAADGPPGRARRARRGVLQGEPALARAGRRARVLAGRRARPRRGRAVARRAAPAAGPRAARPREGVVPRGARHVRRRRRQRRARRDVPGQRPDDRAGAGRDSRARRRRPLHDHPAEGHRVARQARRRGVHARPRRGRDRRDHVVHEHVEPAGDDRRRPRREEGRRARACSAARG